MARLSLRLPDTLHQRLVRRAQVEGVSLNQYLVFLLAQSSAPAYSVVPVARTAAEQKAAFTRLRAELGSGSPDEVRRLLAEREPALPEPEWTEELRERLDRRLGAARRQDGG